MSFLPLRDVAKEHLKFPGGYFRQPPAAEFSFSPLFPTQFGQRDVIFHGQQTDEADGEEGGCHSDAHIHAEAKEEPIEQASGHTGHGIDLLAENDGHVVEQHIADDAAGGTGDAAHGDGHPEGMAEGKGLLKAGDGEKGKAERVNTNQALSSRLSERLNTMTTPWATNVQTM